MHGRVLHHRGQGRPINSIHGYWGSVEDTRSDTLANHVIMTAEKYEELLGRHPHGQGGDQMTSKNTGLRAYSSRVNWSRVAAIVSIFVAFCGVGFWFFDFASDTRTGLAVNKERTVAIEERLADTQVRVIAIDERQDRMEQTLTRIETTLGHFAEDVNKALEK